MIEHSPLEGHGRRLDQLTVAIEAICLLAIFRTEPRAENDYSKDIDTHFRLINIIAG